MAGLSKDVLRKRVRFEERLELALEGHFFFDLVRWDIAEDFLNKYIEREKKTYPIFKMEPFLIRTIAITLFL